MGLQIISKQDQGYGAFNGGEIVENKPIGFPQDGGMGKPLSTLFYWAYASANVDSTIGLHPHKGFEIMSFVLKGHIRHFDTKLNEWKELHAGGAQIIRAGNGISHAEFLAQDAAIFQIWLDPNLQATLSKEASYDDYTSSEFPVLKEDEIEKKKYIGPEGLIKLDTKDIEIEEWKFTGAKSVEPKNGHYFIGYVLENEIEVNGEKVEQDGYFIVDEGSSFELKTDDTAKLFVIQTIQQVPYPTYAEQMRV